MLFDILDASSGLVCPQMILESEVSKRVYMCECGRCGDCRRTISREMGGQSVRLHERKGRMENERIKVCNDRN